MSNRLVIWMNGLPVGYWEHTKRVDVLKYFTEWCSDEQGRPLSLSLPFTPGNQPLSGEAVAAYFDNLLPDSERIRLRLAARYKAATPMSFDMLAALGRDCVGAIQLLPEGERPEALQSISGIELGEHEIAQLLRETVATDVLGQKVHFELRLSVAGAQEKTALLRHQGQWWLPTGNTPTTHLFKLPLGVVGGRELDMRNSVENEWLCSRILDAFALPVANCEMGRFEDQRVLIVERFDRQLSADGSWLIRRPQEDMCQATATPPHLKYQNEGGPGILRILDILAGSESPAQARADFFKTQLIFWLLAATDGHAKNFSIMHLPGNAFRPAPLYDVLSAHPVIGKGSGRVSPQEATMAMALCGTSGNQYKLQNIYPRHWDLTAKRAGMPKNYAGDLIAQVLEALEDVCEGVRRQLPADFPAEVFDKIFAGMRKHASRLKTVK